MNRFINPLRRLLFLFAAMVVGSMPALAQSQADYHGLWWNEDRTGIVELKADDGGIKGVTRWGDKPDTDRNNPDPALRDRSLKGITFLWGFTYEAKKNRWKDGKVYDPKNGKTYDAKLSLAKGGKILKMRGYIGVSLFGRTAEFERVATEEIPASIGY